MSSSRNAALCAVCSLAMFGLFATGVVSGEAQHPDLVIRGDIHHWTSPALTAAMTSFSRYGAPSADAVVVLGVSLVLIVKRRFQAVFCLLCALAGAGVLRYTLARAFHRLRPMPFFAAEPSSYSFPSGHALFAICVYGMLASFLSSVSPNRIVREAVWTAAVLWILAIGISRVYLGFHYPTDVLGGYAIGIAWLSTLALAGHSWPFWSAQSAAHRMPTGP